MHTGESVPLSVGQFIDCDTKKDKSCHGGWMTWAYDYLIEVGGLESWADYDYRAFKRECHFEESKVVAKITGYKEIEAGAEAEGQMMAALKEVGPLPVAVDATAMLHYHRGVISGGCSSKADRVNHGVTIVGYHGKLGEHGAWNVRNSWGTNWGEHGYCKIRKGANTCAIETFATYVEF